jgi:hypothetical protein
MWLMAEIRIVMGNVSISNTVGTDSPLTSGAGNKKMEEEQLE